MTDRIKTFVLKRLEDCNKYAETPTDVYNYRAMAFGLILFALNEPTIDTEGLAEWWENEIWTKFQELAYEVGWK